jgi:hypothetical protein
MLAKVVKPACREANYIRETVKIRDDSSRRDRNIMDVISSRNSRTGGRK